MKDEREKNRRGQERSGEKRLEYGNMRRENKGKEKTEGKGEMKGRRMGNGL